MAAPSSGSIRLRSIVRYIESLSTQSAQNQNRLHAAQSSAVTPGCVIQDLKRAVASLEQRIRKLRCEAMTLVRKDELLHKRYQLLVSVPGIAQLSAIQLLAELSTLPQGLTVRECVAIQQRPLPGRQGISAREFILLSRSPLSFFWRIASFALIWSDRVNLCESVGVFVVVVVSRGQSEQQPGQVERRLISLIFAGRNRIIMIRRELPLTVLASPAEPVA